MLTLKNLKLELKNTKQSLLTVESRIKRLTGHDGENFVIASDGSVKLKSTNNVINKHKFSVDKKRSNESLNNIQKENLFEDEIHSEDDNDNSPGKKILKSTVIAVDKDKRMSNLIRNKYCDTQNVARNRRMLDFMRGTLKKFQREEDYRFQQEKKKNEIDLKVEEAAEREKERMKKEEQQMFYELREKKKKIRCLEKKMEIVELHETWEKSQMFLKNFIKTDAKPHILFLPAKHNANTKKVLKEAKERRLQSINARRAKVLRELAEIEDSYTKEGVEKVETDKNQIATQLSDSFDENMNNEEVSTKKLKNGQNVEIGVLEQINK